MSTYVPSGYAIYSSLYIYNMCVSVIQYIKRTGPGKPTRRGVKYGKWIWRELEKENIYEWHAYRYLYIVLGIYIYIAIECTLGFQKLYFFVLSVCF